MDFKCRKVAELGQGDSLLFPTKSPRDPDIDWLTLKGWKAGSTLKHLVVSNPGFMDNYERTVIMTLGPKVVVLKFDQVWDSDSRL